MSKRINTTLVPVAGIARSIFTLRGQRVLLDAELADLYGVTTKRLNEQVRRNRSRFPEDFIFRLTVQEQAALRSHFATSKSVSASRGGRRYLPYAFTEHGAIQAATILNSPRAVEVSVFIVRAFMRLRGMLASNRELARQLKELEKRLTQRLDSHDQAIAGIVATIRKLMNSPTPPAPKRRPIGFTANLDEVSED